MNYGKMRKYLQVALIPALLVAMTGCAGVGKPTPNETVNKATSAPAVVPSAGASVSIVPSRNGEFIIQGNNVNDIAGFELTISYDSSALSSPTVTKNGENSGAMMAANTTVPGTIRFVMISTQPFSGTVPLATVSFATVKGQAGMSITSVSMVNNQGQLIK